MKVSRCCCCISIEMGVMLLGCNVWFALIDEMDWFNPIRAVITVGTGALFLLMVFKDSARHREYFFYAHLAF